MAANKETEQTKKKTTTPKKKATPKKEEKIVVAEEKTVDNIVVEEKTSIEVKELDLGEALYVPKDVVIDEPNKEIIDGNIKPIEEKEEKIEQIIFDSNDVKKKKITRHKPNRTFGYLWNGQVIDF